MSPHPDQENVQTARCQSLFPVSHVSLTDGFWQDKSIESLNPYVIVTLLCWGLWGILDKKALQTSTQVGVLLRIYIMSAWQLFVLYVFLLLTHTGFHISASLWWWSFWAAISLAFSFTAYLSAMSIGEASFVLGITAAYPIVSQILAVALLHEHLLGERILGGVAITAGVILIGSAPNTGSPAAVVPRRQVFWLWLSILSATFGWGFFGLLDKLALASGTPLETWVAEYSWEAILIVVALMWLKLARFQVELENRSSWLFAVLSALCLAIGKFAYLFALSLSTVSYVVTITACYPLIMYLLAVPLLGEKFARVRFLGILLVVAGGIAVQRTAGS